MKAALLSQGTGAGFARSRTTSASTHSESGITNEIAHRRKRFNLASNNFSVPS
ncbi:hypothetical protein X777_12694 [Ooceraea biroi]|uniref:Uncharacterized protein n=1 Tax=Ooceraea biroi TaxID=2015173 RepID=A0A026VY91_OOCBI|nr:hypothetical protein X777_12694 [Ooceraea biroi]